jgi:aminoglycoside/choline kinase family phosphotransferase
MPQRMSSLENWLHQSCKLSDFTLKPASGDASFRRYFRLQLTDGSTRIVMDAPPDKEDCQPFVQIEQRLRAMGVHVPAIYEWDQAQGFLLLEDLGDELYLDVLTEDTVDRLYGDALSTLMMMQACVDTAGLPDYDDELLLNEMSLFRDWLLHKHLGITLTDAEEQMLVQAFQRLSCSALEQPRVFVHRDYHSRNLLPGVAPVPGVIDFQDAVSGPITYDLVSLLRDCYISWPQELVDEWVMGYFQLCVQSGLMRDEHEERFLRWFDLMGVQRHLKAAGIFARLHHRDGKPGYMEDIPRTLGYIIQVGERQGDMQHLAAFIQEKILPAL